MSSFSEGGIDGGVMSGKEEEGEEVEDGSALTKARAAVWSYNSDGFGVRKGGGSGGDKRSRGKTYTDAQRVQVRKY